MKQLQLTLFCLALALNLAAQQSVMLAHLPEGPTTINASFVAPTAKNTEANPNTDLAWSYASTGLAVAFPLAGGIAAHNSGNMEFQYFGIAMSAVMTATASATFLQWRKKRKR